VQTARFSNLPYFEILPSARSLVVSQGDIDTSQFVTVTSLNGFGGTTGTTVSLSGSSSPIGPTVTVSPDNVTVPVSSDGLAGLTVTVPNTTPPGSYILTLTGTSPGLPPNSVTILLNIPVPDISMVVNPHNLFFNATYSGTSLIMISSIGNFQGNVTISLTFPSQIHATLSNQKTSQTLRLTSKGTNTTALTVSSTIAGNYYLNTTATSGSLVHISTITVLVMDFQLEAIHGPTPGPLILVKGTSDTEFILVTATDNYYNATVTIGQVSVYQVQANGTAPSNGITVGCHPTVLSITSFMVIRGSNETDCSVTARAIGNYTVTVAAAAGSGIHTSSHSVSFQVTVVLVAPPPPPNFNISTNSTSFVVSAGSNATSTVTLSSIDGFAGTIILTAAISPFYPWEYGGIEPIAIFHPSSVVLSSGGTATSILLLATNRTTSTTTYSVEVFGHSGNLTQLLSILVRVQPPLDIPPVADFTFTPKNPVVGENINFEGSRSFDPDGTLVSWAWSFGNGLFTTGEFASATYNTAGNFTVTLTVTDNAGLSSSTSTTISVISQPAHDVAIVLVNPQPRTVVSTQTVFVQVQLTNNGLSNENVSVAAYANGRPIQTLRGLFVPACVPSPYNFCGYRNYFTLRWDTSGVAPGNYTISARVFLAPGEVDPTPADNNLSDGMVTVLPAPVITLSPNTGPDGTKVLVQGTGFPVQEQYGYASVVYIDVNFDNMTVGFTLSHNGTFTFTFDIPLSQAGAHGVFAFDRYSGARASTTFAVQSPPNNNLAVSIDMGTVYFPGDTAVAYILTAVNGTPVGAQNVQLQVVLFKPDGTNITMTATRIGTGLYKATYTIPSSGPLGTYLVVAKAHQPGPMDASSLVSFEVKLTWLRSNSGRITVGATTLVGLVTLAGAAWKKGYLRRKKDNESSNPRLPS
jgi:PKD repeat protein